MVKHTKKPNKKFRNKTSKIKVVKRNQTDTKKRCYTDNEMGTICNTGEFSVYKGNFYKNEDNIIKFKKIRKERKLRLSYFLEFINFLIIFPYF